MNSITQTISSFIKVDTFFILTCTFSLIVWKFWFRFVTKRSYVLFRFVNLNVDEKRRVDDDDELNAFFIITLIEIKKVFRNWLLKNYIKNFVWKRISILLNVYINVKNNVFFLFIKKMNEFFVRMIILLTVMFSSHANFAFYNRSSTKF